MKDQNWVLYYALIRQHLKELIPIIYTPTQAEAIANYSHLFRRSEGLYLTYANEETMEEDFLEQTRGRDLQLFVVSDAEAILGIGDQGVGVRSASSLCLMFFLLFIMMISIIGYRYRDCEVSHLHVSEPIDLSGTSTKAEYPVWLEAFILRKL